MAVETRILVVGEGDIIVARQRAREMAKSLGFGAVDQSRIATAVSELTRNVVRYATGGRGEVFITSIPASPPRIVGLEITVTDGGPGIEDIELALRDGFTTGSGMGLGLPGAKRLVDEMEIDSALGRGTTITVRKWRR